MKKFALLALVGAALFATNGAASAQYGPGVGVYIGPPERGYDERRYRYDRERYSDYDRRHYDYDRRHYRQATCRRGYSVQDGVCKPYRGY
jgi:hypothetical protein